MKPFIILGSSSPRRRDLLAAFYRLKIVRPDIDEVRKPSENPISYVRRLALEKWQKVAADYPDNIILCADTTVSRGDQIFEKARNSTEAREFLEQFSAKKHLVTTAVCVGVGSQKKIIHVSTEIKFRALTNAEIRAYIKSGEWQGKAGAYGIQGAASQFVDVINGSLTNVIGLPLKESIRLIELW